MIRKQESFVKMEYEFLYELLVIPCANCREKMPSITLDRGLLFFYISLPEQFQRRSISYSTQLSFLDLKIERLGTTILLSLEFYGYLIFADIFASFRIFHRIILRRDEIFSAVTYHYLWRAFFAVILVRCTRKVDMRCFIDLF